MAPSSDAQTLRLDETTLRRWLLFAAALASGLGLVAELLHYVGKRSSLVLGFFSLSLEGNFPNWYASLLLAGCGLLLLLIAAGVRQTAAPFFRHWCGLGLGFLYLSLDEAVELHEKLGGLLRLRGVLYFSWVVPAGLLVLVVGLSYLRFLGHLPHKTRWRFILAGCIYVGGALGMELPLGWWTERAGSDNLGYALIDWVEETLELFGATLFLLALLGHLRSRHAAVALIVAPPQ